MTGIFKELAFAPGHGNLRSPWLGKCRGIVYREFVEDGVLVNAREALDQAQLIVGAPEGCSSHASANVTRQVREVGSLDTQGVAFPVAPRISHPLPDAWREVRPPVGGNDAN